MFSRSRQLTQEQNDFCVEGERLSLVLLPPDRGGCRDHTRSRHRPSDHSRAGRRLAAVGSSTSLSRTSSRRSTPGTDSLSFPFRFILTPLYPPPPSPPVVTTVNAAPNKSPCSDGPRAKNSGCLCACVFNICALDGCCCTRQQTPNGK